MLLAQLARLEGQLPITVPAVPAARGDPNEGDHQLDLAAAIHRQLDLATRHRRRAHES